MSFETPVEMWSERRSEEDENGRTYYMGWSVVADSENDVYDALASVGVDYGEPFDAFPLATCKTRSAARLGSANIYKAIAGYRRDGGSGINPNNYPWTVETLRGTETEAIDSDAEGNPIVNSAGDPYEGDTKEVVRRFIRFNGWEEFYDLRKAIAFEDALNTDTVTIGGIGSPRGQFGLATAGAGGRATLEPGQVRLVEYSPSGAVQFKGGKQVPSMVGVSYLFELRGPRLDTKGKAILDKQRGNLHTGFYTRRLDAGFQAYFSNNDEKITLGDDPPAVLRGKIQVAVDTDLDTVTSAVRLNGKGVPIDQSFYVAKHTHESWSEVDPPTGAVVDDSNPKLGVFLLHLKNPRMPMGNLLNTGRSPFQLGA